MLGRKCKFIIINLLRLKFFSSISTVIIINVYKRYVIKYCLKQFNPFDVKPKGTDGSYFTIYARPNDGDDSDGYWQIMLLTPSNLDDSPKPWVTKTNYDIVELIHYDNENDFLLV